MSEPAATKTADFSRCLAVLWSPTDAFTSLRMSPRAPLLLAVIGLTAALPALAFLSRVDLPAFLLEEMQHAAPGQAAPESAMRFVRETLAPLLRYALPLGAVLARSLSIVVVAAVGYAALRGLRPGLSLPLCIAAVSLGSAPLLLHDGLSVVVLLGRELADVDVRNPVLSNPAAWLGLHIERSALGAALHGLDVFRLWAAYLAARGLCVVAERASTVPFALTFGGQAV
ncbi:MAG: hypothetical protein ACO3JL_08670, partial [Myxococcota bacterium]